MKKIILLLSMAFSIHAVAQPVLQSSNIHTGTNLLIYTLSNANINNVAQAGANITWDLSAATLGSAIGEFDFVDMASTGYATQYPTANFALKFVIGGTTKYDVSYLTANALEDVAINVGIAGLQTFSDDRTTLPFPFSYGDNIVDTYQKNGQSATTETLHYDAYGTLKVGNMTFPNLVRVMNNDVGAGSTQAVWWNASPIYPVLSVSNSSVTFYQLSTSSGIVPVNQQSPFKIYPGSTKRTFIIEGIEANQPLNIDVFNMLGKNVYLRNNFNLLTSNAIDLSNIQKGVYIVRVNEGDQFYNQKIIVQ
ncbi:MAG: T9SS type A sorting domain-containing protein [Paludibacter sp.]|nr:T9SS type A sorting domain-containing protein [Paludibacter sp.]